MTERRRFGRRERTALYLATDGKCAICGTPLERGWHADHITPYSKGGPTDIVNGQALCPVCNQEKSDRMNVRKIDKIHWRKWQEQAYSEYIASSKRDFLLVATPGAGKTFFAGRIMAKWLQARDAQFIVAICPTDHLKTQWANAMHKLGLNFLPKWTNGDGDPPVDVDGVVITYQQLAFGADSIRRLIAKRNGAAVIDEIHHAGETLVWGERLQYALEYATYRLAMSGTPFRSDNNPIPFVEYDETGRSKADFVYDYADALRDQNVVRTVFFPSYEGTLEWMSNVGRQITADFSDKLNQQLSAERLRTALDYLGDWLPDVIYDANEKLSVIRANGHPNAGGLIIAFDINHAQGIRSLVRNITGEDAVIAVSDDPDASDNIAKFDTGNQRWLIAVKMVSEGVDIKRLRVGIYATTVTTELFFRQAVGRFVRWIEGLEDQPAYLYIPKDETLVGYALAIKEERDHVLRELIERPVSRWDDTDHEWETRYMPISSEARQDDVIINTERLTQGEIANARRILDAVGKIATAEAAAMLLREFSRQNGSQDSVQHQPEPRDERPMFEERKRLSAVCNQLANKLAAMLGMEPADIHTMWIKQGNKRTANATIEDLRRKRDWLIAMEQDLKNGKR